MYPPSKKLSASPMADKSSLLGKILSALKRNYSEIYEKIKYDNIDLREDLGKYLKLIDIQNFNQNKFIEYVQQEIIKRQAIKGQNGLNENQEMNAVSSVKQIKEISNKNKGLSISVSTLDPKYLVMSSPKMTINSTQENKIKISNSCVFNTESPKSKLEVLKKIKEKDEWALLARKEFEHYQEEMKKKKVNQQSVEKHVKETLIQQQEEHKNSKLFVKENDKEHLNIMRRDYEVWLKNEESKKLEQLKKMRLLDESRRVFIQNKKLKSEENLQEEKTLEKTIIEKVFDSSLKEKEKQIKKKELDIQLYRDQISDMLLRRNLKKQNFEKEKENGIIYLKEYDKIMEKLENERTNYVTTIKNKMKIQDLRQNLMSNIKESENEVKKELEMKYMREKEEIDRKNKFINDYNTNKKKEMMEEVKKTIEEQIKSKKHMKEDIANKDKEFDSKLKKNLNDYKKDLDEIESIKRKKVLKYKYDLDKQLDEKKASLHRPLMDETERQLNKAFFS